MVETLEICCDIMRAPDKEITAAMKRDGLHSAYIPVTSTLCNSGIAMLIRAGCYWKIVTKEATHLNGSLAAINRRLVLKQQPAAGGGEGELKTIRI